MNALYISLIAIGALIIVAVLLFNWWQERRFRQQVNHHFDAIQADPLFNEHLPTEKMAAQASKEREHIEPYLEAQPIVAETASVNQTTGTLVVEEGSFEALDGQEKENSVVEANQADVLLESFTALDNHSQHITEIPSAAISHSQAVKGSLDVPVISLPAMLHAQVDLIAVLYLAEVTMVEAVNNQLKDLFVDYDKPVFLHGLNTDKQWGLLNHLVSSAMVSKLTCSLQLADRAGAVSRSILNRFQLAVETLGLDLNAHVEWQSTGDVLAMANRLDAFCIEVDKTMGFHLVHGEQGAFTGTKLRGLAEAQGFTLAADGTFLYIDEHPKQDYAQQPQPAFTMFNRDHYPFSLEMLRTSVVKAVTFQLDIPRVVHCTEAFNVMVQVARQMETGLNAVLVDDNQRPLGDIQIEKIRQQLKVIHATMLVRGIVPGSETALRLFS